MNDPREDWVLLKDVPMPRYPPFVISDIVHDVVTVMYGRPEAGKSFLALSFAESLITGEPWFGYEVRETRRVAYWMLDPGQISQTKGRARKFPACEDSLFVCSRRPAPGRWAPEAEGLARAGIDFLIIDNLTRMMPGGLSVRDDAAVEPLLRDMSVMEQYGIGVLLLHHAGKPGEDGNPKKTPLGATAIESWSRHFLRVEVEETKVSKDRKVISYGNDLAGEKVIPFKIDDEMVTECRDASLDAERLQQIIDGQPWKSQRAIAAGIGISQSQVQRVLARKGYQLDSDTGIVAPKVQVVA